MELPSKELMSEIYKTRCIKVSMTYETIIDFYIKGNEGREAVNIYELMHMMKEWACQQRMYFSTNHRNKEIYGTLYIKSDTKSSIYNMAEIWIAALGAHKLLNEVDDDEFCAPTEFEAVTKACEWILKELK